MNDEIIHVDANEKLCPGCEKNSHFSSEIQPHCDACLELDSCSSDSSSFLSGPEDDGHLTEISNGLDRLQKIMEFPNDNYKENEEFLQDYSIESPSALSILLGLLHHLHYEWQGTDLSFNILFGNHWFSPTHSLENCRQKAYGLGTLTSKFSHISLHLLINIVEETEFLEMACSEFICSFFKGYIDNIEEDSFVDAFKFTITPSFCNQGKIIFQKFIKKTFVKKLVLVSNKIYKKQEKCHDLNNLLPSDDKHSWSKKVKTFKIKNMTLTDSSCEGIIKMMGRTHMERFSLNGCFYLPDKRKTSFLRPLPWNGLLSRGAVFCSSIKTIELDNMGVLTKKDSSPSPHENRTTVNLFLKEMQRFFLKNRNPIVFSLRGFNIPFLQKDWFRFFKILKKSKSLTEEINFSNSKVRIPALFLFASSEYIVK